MEYQIGHDEYYKGTHKEDINEGAIYNYCVEFYCPDGKCVCGYHKEHENDACAELKDKAHFEAWEKNWIYKTFTCIKSKIPIICEDWRLDNIKEIHINSRGVIEVTYYSNNLECPDEERPERAYYKRVSNDS